MEHPKGYVNGAEPVRSTRPFWRAATFAVIVSLAFIAGCWAIIERGAA